MAHADSGNVRVAIVPDPFGREFELHAVMTFGDRVHQADVTASGDIAWSLVEEGLKATPMMRIADAFAVDFLRALHAVIEEQLRITHTDPAVVALTEALGVERVRVDNVLARLTTSATINTKDTPA